jgi:hypothetical protein
MARMKRYDKGYLDGQLDSAENELEILYKIKDESNEQWDESDTLLVRIKDMEDFLKEHERLIK